MVRILKKKSSTEEAKKYYVAVQTWKPSVESWQLVLVRAFTVDDVTY